MNIEDIQELLDRYVTGVASEAELAQVELLKKTDPQFKAQFQEHLHLVEGVREFREQQLRAKLLEVVQKNNETPTEIDIQRGRVVSFFRNNWRAVAAVAVFVVALFGVYQQQTFHERVYAHHAPDRLNFITAGGDAAEEDALHMENFTRYILGIKLSQNQKYQASIDTLSVVSPSVELYYFYAQYEIALVHVLQKDDAAARQQLEKVLEMPGDHVVKEKAKAMLEELDKPKWMPF